MNLKLGDFAPFLSWMRRYRRPHLQADLFGGLTVAVAALPQSMAYALITGLWGSSAHLVTGPTTAVSSVEPKTALRMSTIDLF